MNAWRALAAFAPATVGIAALVVYVRLHGKPGDLLLLALLAALMSCAVAGPG